MYRKTVCVLAGIVLLVTPVAGCGAVGSNGQGGSNDAKTYVQTVATDAAQVQSDEIKVGLDILSNDVTALASDAQTAHDDYANVKTDIIAAGNNVGDNTPLGNAEYQMDNGIDELKNGMGAIVAAAENPNAGTIGAANSKLGRGITDWDEGAAVMWALAGKKSETPTLNGSTPGPTTSTPGPSTTTAPIPAYVPAGKVDQSNPYPPCPNSDVVSNAHGSPGHPVYCVITSQQTPPATTTTQTTSTVPTLDNPPPQGWTAYCKQSQGVPYSVCSRYPGNPATGH